VFEPFNAVVWGRRERGAVELTRDRAVERVNQQGGFAAAGHAGDAGEQAKRDFCGNIFQVVAARVDDLQRAPFVGCAPLGDRHTQFAGEIFAGP
jgi:hypothetical protein